MEEQEEREKEMEGEEGCKERGEGEMGERKTVRGRVRKEGERACVSRQILPNVQTAGRAICSQRFCNIPQRQDQDFDTENYNFLRLFRITNFFIYFFLFSSRMRHLWPGSTGTLSPAYSTQAIRS